MDLAALKKYVPSVDWDVVLGGVDLAEAKNFIVNETTRDPRWRQTSRYASRSTHWKAYMTFHFVDSYATDLPKAFDDAQFEFRARTLRGIQQQRDRWKRGMTMIDNNIGEGLGQIYVRKHFVPETKAKMDELVANLLAATKQRLEQLAWMDDATRAEALKKLATFEPRIGYPDKWRDYSALIVERGKHFENARNARVFEWERRARRLKEPVDRSEWDMTPQTMDAYYNPLKNQITFPAGILQPPMFDPNADPAVNYGAIGAVIGHEIGHGFDDQGREFDGSGKVRNWWTPETNAKFVAATKNLAALYQHVLPARGRLREWRAHHGREHRRRRWTGDGVHRVPAVIEGTARAGAGWLHRRPAILHRLRTRLAGKNARRHAAPVDADQSALARRVRVAAIRNATWMPGTRPSTCNQATRCISSPRSACASGSSRVHATWFLPARLARYSCVSAACTSSSSSADPSHCASADADRDREIGVSRPPVVRRDMRAQRFAEHRGVRARHAGQDQRELFAADARHQVAVRGSCGASTAAHCRKRLIAHRVAELVVHGLEVIEIGDRNAERLADGERHFDLGREPLHEAAPVGDARQRILLRLALQPQAAFAQHGDQAFLLGVRLLELGRALGDALLEMPAIIFQVLEGARVGERARDLLAQLSHQVQIGAGVDAGLRCAARSAGPARCRH